MRAADVVWQFLFILIYLLEFVPRHAVFFSTSSRLRLKCQQMSAFGPELILAQLSFLIKKFKRPNEIYWRLVEIFLDWFTFVAFTWYFRSVNRLTFHPAEFFQLDEFLCSDYAELFQFLLHQTHRICTWNCWSNLVHLAMPSYISVNK